jgi:hypothetical protein
MRQFGGCPNPSGTLIRITTKEQGAQLALLGGLETQIGLRSRGAAPRSAWETANRVTDSFEICTAHGLEGPSPVVGIPSRDSGSRSLCDARADLDRCGIAGLT